MTDMFLWCDLETTGLDCDRDRVLEVAAILTDAELVVLDEYTTVIDQSDLSARSLSDTVRQMHEKSGLLAEALVPSRDAVPLHKADSYVWSMGAPWKQVEPDTKVILAGSSVHFDRGFIDRHLPRTAEQLHYRHLDVSAVETLARCAGLEFPRTDRPHRALPDIRDTLRVARRFLEYFRYANFAPRVVTTGDGRPPFDVDPGVRPWVVVP